MFNFKLYTPYHAYRTYVHSNKDEDNSGYSINTKGKFTSIA